MKSKSEQLASRGFVKPGVENQHFDATYSQRVTLLNSKIPAERTLGARLLANNADLSAIDYLIAALKIEFKLYTKIAICNSLVSYGKRSVIPLIELLGKIGSNQHTTIPETNFKKVSYPLPRDIAGRTLVRIGTAALPELFKVLETDNLLKLSEALDTIGFICFYDYQPEVFQLLRDCFYRNGNNNLIKWKIIRAMRACPESVSFLHEQLLTGESQLKVEIERSLSLIKKRTR